MKYEVILTVLFHLPYAVLNLAQMFIYEYQMWKFLGETLDNVALFSSPFKAVDHFVHVIFLFCLFLRIFFTDIIAAHPV